MKKILFTMMALLAIAGTSKAQTNALSVADIELPQNYEASLIVSFQFDAADTYTGYSFNLELPSDLEFVMAEGTEVACIPGACHAAHQITANLDGGLVKVAGLSLSSKPLTGTSGVLLTFTIKPKGELTIGKTYTGNIKDILIVPVEGTKKNLENSTFTITIGEPADLRTILDETSTTAPEAATGVDVRVKKTIKANEWSTICLPFAMSETQVKAAFGDDVKLGDFTGYTPEYEGDENVTAITVNFDEATAIEANHPYIIKVSSAITDFTADGVTINPDEAIVSFGYNTGSGKNKKYHPSDFIGTYVADFDFYNEANSYPLFLNGNKFWYATENSMHMKAFRAFFDLDEYLPEVEDAGAPVFFSFNNDITGIKNIQRSAEDGKYYNLNGQRVESLKKGEIYINNGKKVVVK